VHLVVHGYTHPTDMSTKHTDKYNKTLIAIAVGVLVFCAITILIIALPPIIERKIREVIPTMSNRLHSIEFDKLNINSISSAQIEQLTIMSSESDTLLTAKRVALHISPWRAILGKIDIKALAIDSMQVAIIENDSISNPSKNPDDKETIEHKKDITEIDWAKKADRISTILFSKTPKKVKIKDLKLRYSINSNQGVVTINHANIEQESSHERLYKAKITTSTDSTTQQITLEGSITDGSTPSISGHIYPNDSTSSINIPQITSGSMVNASFKDLEFELNFNNLSSDSVVVRCLLDSKSPSINYWRISSKRVTIPEIVVDLEITILPKEVKIQPNSSLKINQLTLHPTVTIGYSEDWYARVALDEPLFNAQDMMSAIPDGLFNSFNTAKLSGDLGYHLLIDVDLSKPDSLIFESKLTKGSNFKIDDIGELNKMNNTFTYYAYDDDVLLRSFALDDSNPEFRRASEITPLLRNAILQSEDGQFFYHKGFRMESLREALIHDLKVRRFARGGSTISMQIIKNVFLSREKSITRKLEEALIVWLIEENRVTSKVRMFDIYINIIEWGPNIYGVTEAARFYFDKNPNELTLDEAIFMASIIPRPTKYRWSFTPEGELAEHQYPHFRIVKERLIHNGVIDQYTDPEQKPFVLLRGRAKEIFTK